MVGTLIKQYLEENGIKQTFLAQKLGMTASVVSDICSGNRRIDCVEYLHICRALNLPLDFFLKDIE